MAHRFRRYNKPVRSHRHNTEYRSHLNNTDCRSRQCNTPALPVPKSVQTRSDHNKPPVRFRRHNRLVRFRQHSTGCHSYPNNTDCRFRQCNTPALPVPKSVQTRSDHNKPPVRFRRHNRLVRFRQHSTGCHSYPNNTDCRFRQCNTPALPVPKSVQTRSDHNKPPVRFRRHNRLVRSHRHSTGCHSYPNNTDYRFHRYNKRKRSAPVPRQRSDQNKPPVRFRRHNRLVRFHQHSTGCHSYPNNTDCRFHRCNNRRHSFRRRHNRTVPDLPAGNHNRPDRLRTLRYPDNYKRLPADRKRNNPPLRWTRPHSRIPSCRPNHNRLRQRLSVIKKRLRPNWRSNRTNPFSAVRAISFWAGFLPEPGFPPRPLRIPTYTAYRNIHGQAAESAACPIRQEDCPESRYE